MRYRFAHVLLFLVCLFAGSVTARTQVLDVVAEVLTPALDVQPRQTVSLQVRFTNAGTAWRTVASTLAVPAGWIVLVPPADVTLAPGEVYVVLLAVLVASDAAASVYTFPLTYRTGASGPSAEAAFTVRVPAIDQATLTLEDAPAVVSAAVPHRVEFLLHNTGNTTHEWDLTASSSLSLPVDLTPGVVALGPGDSATVVALVGAPERLAQQQTHALTITATSRSAPAVRATARAAVPMVPTNLPAASALHSFPLTLSASYGAGLHAGGDAQPRLALELSGRGTLGDRDPGQLGVRLRITFLGHLEHVELEYQRPAWGVRLGDQDFAVSPLSSSVGGFGVRANATGSLGVADPLRAEVAAYQLDGAARFTLAVTAALPHGTQVVATLGGGRADLLGTLGIRYAPERRDASRLQVTALEATYGLRIDGDFGFDQALRAGAQVNLGPSFGRLTYDTAAASFDGRDRHHATLGVAAALRLNDALSIQARFPINLALRYDRTWAWDDDLVYGLLPPGDALGQEQRFTVGLSAGLGAATVNATYVLTITSAQAYEAQQELRTLVRSRITDDFTVAVSSVWIRRRLRGTTLSETLELQTGAVLPIAQGLATSALTLTHDLGTGLASGLAFGVKWAGELTPDLRLTLDTTLHLIDPSERWRAELDLRYLLGSQRALTTKVTGQARADRPLALTFEVGFAMPLQIPIGRRSDIGRLEGSVTWPDGRGLQGTIVTVAGQAVTTTSDGAFRFPALPIGVQQVRVVPAGALAANQYLAPDLPASVDIADGATSELHFVVREAATVAGRITTDAVDPTTDRFAIVPGGSADGLERGLRIELHGDAAMLHTVADANGAFRFQRVPAGEWTLYVVLPRTAVDYRLDPAEARLVLAPGDHAEVPVRLVPIVRQIQFMDGGTLRTE